MISQIWSTARIALLVGIVAGCSDSNFVSDPSFSSTDELLRLNHIQVIGTHNSYHTSPAVPPMSTIVKDQYAFLLDIADYRHKPLYEQLDQLGVRSMALDINADPLGGNYSDWPLLATIGEDPATGIPELDLPGIKVFHIPQVDAETSCHLLTDCLSTVKQWSNEHPGHTPIILTIEIKDIDVFSTGTHVPIVEWQVDDYDRLDAEIRSVFPAEQLITPDDVRGDFTTLEEAILTVGWPTLAESRGKIMFAMCNCFGGGRRHFDYTIGHENLVGRILFPYTEPGHPDAALIRRGNPINDSKEIQQLVSLGYIVRTRADANTVEARVNNIARRDAAFASGSQIVNTDYPEPDAPGHPDYFVQIPGGNPAGCNPVTAPDWCRPSHIEKPGALLAADFVPFIYLDDDGT